MRIDDIVERRRRRRELDQDGFDKLLAMVRETGERLGWGVVPDALTVDLDCIDCYRDGGCREHSPPGEPYRP